MGKNKEDTRDSPAEYQAKKSPDEARPFCPFEVTDTDPVVCSDVYQNGNYDCKDTQHYAKRRTSEQKGKEGAEDDPNGGRYETQYRSNE